MESSTKFRDFGKDLIAGGASGIVAKCISAPIERVKLLLQTQSVNSQIKSNSVPYKGGFDCVRRVYLEQGLWSFWRGNVANISRYFPSQAINFAMKDQYKKAFSVDEKLNPNLAYLANFTSGGLAGATALTFIYPLDVARTRLATDIGNNKIRRKFNSTLGCLTEVYKANGVRGLYSGYGAAIGGVVVFRALYLGGYDSAKLKFDLHEKSLFIKYITAQVCPLECDLSGRNIIGENNYLLIFIIINYTCTLLY